MDGAGPTPEQMENLQLVYFILMAHVAAEKKKGAQGNCRCPMLDQLNQEQMEKMSAAFDQCDEDGDQILNLQEWLNFRKHTCTKYNAPLMSDAANTTLWETLSKQQPDFEGVKKETLTRAAGNLQRVKMKPGCQYRIWYFGFYGRSEAMRFLFCQSGISFDDKVFSQENWPKAKPFAVPGGLPQVEHADGSLKGGSARAMVRYLGLKHGYYPDDPLRAQECDMIVDAYYDIFTLLGDAGFGKGFDPSTIGETRPKFWEALDKFLAFIEPFCQRGPWLCGPKMCVADFWVGSFVSVTIKNPNCPFGHDTGDWEKRCKQFPAFKAWGDKFIAANETRMKTRPAGLPL